MKSVLALARDGLRDAYRVPDVNPERIEAFDACSGRASVFDFPKVSAS